MEFHEYLVRRGILSNEAIKHAMRIKNNPSKIIDQNYRSIINILLLICALDEVSIVKYYNEYLTGMKKDNPYNGEYVATINYEFIKESTKILNLDEQIELHTVPLKLDSYNRVIILGFSSSNNNLLTKARMIVGNRLPNYNIKVVNIFEVPYLSWVKKGYEAHGLEFDPKELQIAVDEKLNTIFRVGVESRATDISIEPGAKFTKIRLTIDKEPVFLDTVRLSKDETEEVHNWIIAKSEIGQSATIESTMDCALPSLGNMKSHRGRVNRIISNYGAAINIRPLPNEPRFIDLNTLGYSKYVHDYLQHSSKIRKGLFMIVGPTNSGKNTSIYAMLLLILKSKNPKIISLEDPIEYIVPDVIQTEASSDEEYRNMSKALVRQSPDIVYLSEIRDRITAESILSISNTGKLAISTMHVAYAYQFLSRFNDLAGKDISSEVVQEMLGIINQVLVPKACPDCIYEKDRDDISQPIIEVLNKHKYNFPVYENSGRTLDGKLCPTCAGNGYKDIVPVAEFIDFNFELKRRIRSVDNVQDREEILLAEMQRTNNSLVDDALRHMRMKNLSLSMIIEKSIIDIPF